jgi:hypothetical protein
LRVKEWRTGEQEKEEGRKEKGERRKEERERRKEKGERRKEKKGGGRWRKKEQSVLIKRHTKPSNKVHLLLGQNNFLVVHPSAHLEDKFREGRGKNEGKREEKGGWRGRRGRGRYLEVKFFFKITLCEKFSVDPRCPFVGHFGVSKRWL